MKLLIGLLFGASLLTCQDESFNCPPAECPLEATVIDYTGMDGCGLVLETTEGDRFIPLRLTYIQAPTPEEDPIYHFDLVAGQKVYFGYRAAEGATTCMIGDVVFITCIKSVSNE